ncbi:hypothetical protein BDV59DRAFT_186200 [Aspergillus ambiguus]|uniref:uncharacterized protein n=1 Tax=Aspergillus ambiguus TaxID=176160 RepID=UPI003CCCD8D0
MARLDVNAGRYTPGRGNRAAKEPITVKDVGPDPRSVFYYDGYTFFKSDVLPGQRSTWSNVEKKRMHLSQADLHQMVQKHKKKFSAASQYQNLTRAKRTAVDELIEELRQNDPRYEWTCVYIKESEKAVKGKNSRRGDYETLSMDIILSRKAVNTGSYSKTPQPVQVSFDTTPKGRDGFAPRFEDPMINHEPHRSMNKPFENWPAGPDPKRTSHPMFGQVPQQVPPQFHQQGHPAGGAPPVSQDQWAGIPAGMRPPQQHPDMMNGARAGGLGHAPPIEVLNGNNPMAGNLHQQGQGFPNGHHQFGPPGRENVHVAANIPPPHRGPPQAPNPPMDAEHDYLMESSSAGDAESMLFDDPEEYSSATEGSDDDGQYVEPSHARWRGSLYRQHSSKSRRAESRYRTHYRKQPRNANNDPKYVRAPHGGAHPARYPDGYVEVTPADSRNPLRRVPKGYPTRAVARLTRDRPKIVQEPVVVADDLALVGSLGEKYDKLRIRHDIRDQLLDDREARVKRREQMVEERQRMLDECYLGRCMSMREPGYYHRHY